jgi:hypothetical protein
VTPEILTIQLSPTASRALVAHIESERLKRAITRGRLAHYTTLTPHPISHALLDQYASSVKRGIPLRIDLGVALALLGLFGATTHQAHKALTELGESVERLLKETGAQ